MAKRYWLLLEGLFWIRVPQREKSRQNLRTKGRKATGGKLFHREERPALERNIIDTSERARANYRYVIGQHFGL